MTPDVFLDHDVIVGGFSAMAAAVSLLYLNGRASSKRTEDKLEKCEAQHEARTGDLLHLTERVGRLEGVNQFSGQVLAEVKKLRAE
jgi:hypothetical protein